MALGVDQKARAPFRQAKRVCGAGRGSRSQEHCCPKDIGSDLWPGGDYSCGLRYCAPIRDGSPDQQRVYRLASLKQGGVEPEQKHFRSVLEMEAPEDPGCLARKRAARDRGLLPQIQEISFEIDMLWQYGLDVNDAQEGYILRALSGGSSLAM